MRIGILTLPLHTNYGGILQAYALITILKEKGHEPYLIQIDSKIPAWKMFFIYFKRLMLRAFGIKNEIFYERRQKYERQISEKEVKRFIDEKINPKTRAVRIKKLRNEVIRLKLDTVVVGSDQVWRPKYVSNIEIMFLSFLGDLQIKKISYAASFGTEEWEYSEKQSRNCKRLLQRFDKVTVREKSGVDMCFKYWNIKANWVLDPTLLLSKEHYKGLISSVPKSEGNLFVYFLDHDPSHSTIINEIINKKKLIPFYMSTDSKSVALNRRITKPVEVWLRGFYDAELIITDSFHACIFSIIFEKQFILIPNRTRGMSRFESLFEDFGINNCDEFDNNLDKLINSLNWENVYNKLNERRNYSISQLC